MNIVLRRPMNVFQVNVTGRLAFAEERVAEHAVVVWAAERLEQGLEARIPDLCEEAARGPLVGLSPIVGRRLARICEDLGLLVRDGERIASLTLEGQHVGASDEPRIFVPQRGSWSIFWSNDPLLAHPLLHIELWKEPSLHEEEKYRPRKGGNGAEPKRNWMTIPGALKAICDEKAARPPLRLVSGGAPLRVVALEEKGELALKPQASVSAELSFDPSAEVGALRISGSIAGKRFEERLPSPQGHDHASVFFSLLRSNGADAWWNHETGKLRTSVSALNLVEMKSFQRALKFKAPDIQGLGRFEDTVVDGVPIEPATLADAQRWFERLLVDRAQATQWPDVFARNMIELRSSFPGFRLHEPTQIDLARALRAEERPMASYWHLQGPLDLGGGMFR